MPATEIRVLASADAAWMEQLLDIFGGALEDPQHYGAVRPLMTEPTKRTLGGPQDFGEDAP